MRKQNQLAVEENAAVAQVIPQGTVNGRGLKRIWLATLLLAGAAQSECADSVRSPGLSQASVSHAFLGTSHALGNIPATWLHGVKEITPGKRNAPCESCRPKVPNR